VRSDALAGLSGLLRQMPLTGVTLLAGGLSLAGLPPLGGFHVQRLLISGLLRAHHPLVAEAVLLADALLLFAVITAFRGAFLRKEPPPPVARSSGWLTAQLLLLTAALLLAGIWPGPLLRWTDVILHTTLAVSP